MEKAIEAGEEDKWNKSKSVIQMHFNGLIPENEKSVSQVKKMPFIL